MRASGAAPRVRTTVVTSTWPVRARATLTPPGCLSQLRSESTAASSPTRATRWVASSWVRGSWHSAYQRRAVAYAVAARSSSAESSTNSVAVERTSWTRRFLVLALPLRLTRVVRTTCSEPSKVRTSAPTPVGSANRSSWQGTTRPSPLRLVAVDRSRHLRRRS